MSKTIDLRDVLAFVVKITPNGSSERQRMAAVRFYSWLVRETKLGNLDLVFICPHCSLNMSGCQCPQLGHENDLEPGTWVHFADTAIVVQWRLQTSSLTRVNLRELGASSNATRLAQFIYYLKQH